MCVYVIENAFKLKLSQQLKKIHSIISQIHLKSYDELKLALFIRNISAISNINFIIDKKEYKIKRILIKRINQDRTKYLIQ